MENIYLLEAESEMRLKFEEYEGNIKKAWSEACNEWKVKHVYDLPKGVYSRICEEYIEKPGWKLFSWLSEKSAEWSKVVPVKENPYALGLVALQSYNFGGKK